MVNAVDLRLSEPEVNQLCSKVRLGDSDESAVDYFASLTWAVICEPGDAFAGQLISTFGAGRALALELARTDANS